MRDPIILGPYSPLIVGNSQMYVVFDRYMGVSNFLVPLP